MVQTPVWQKLVSRGKKILSGLQRIAPNWQSILKKCLPYILVAVFACVTTFVVLAVRGSLLVQKNSIISEEELLALEESKKELEQTVVKTEQLLNQVIANNEDMRLLLKEAEQEESEMTEVIQDLQDAYNMLNQKWYIPIKYTVCTSPFGVRKHPVEGASKFHYGVDLAAPLGTPIVATRGGTITIAKYDEEAGYYVEIDHLDGYTSRYLHMARYIVTAGQIVIPGQVIGYCGATGVATGPHLHFSIYQDGKAVNPADYMEI